MTDAEKAAFKANAERLTRQIEESDAKSIVNMMKPELADCDPDAASLTLAFPGQPWECNPTGAVHGGLVATMFDTAMGIASFAVTGELTPTMSLTISYALPAPGDGRLLTRAKVTMAGRSVMYVTAEMWEEQTPERIVATAQAVFRRYAVGPDKKHA